MRVSFQIAQNKSASINRAKVLDNVFYVDKQEETIAVRIVRLINKDIKTISLED